jgi:hypothetical protein
MDPMSKSHEDFVNFSVIVHNAELPIVHWKTSKFGPDAQATYSWNRYPKPNVKDFIPFRNEGTWICGIGHFVASITKQGLYHLLDKEHCVTNKELTDNRELGCAVSY